MKFLTFLSVLACYSSNALRLNNPSNHLGITDEWNNFFSSFGNNQDENSIIETSENEGRNYNYGEQPQQYEGNYQSQELQIEGKDEVNNGSSFVVQPRSEAEDEPTAVNPIKLSVSPTVVPESPTLIN